jgi:hypothetical protein
MDGSMESLLSVVLGVGLAAAAGFRVFVPLLVAGVAARLGLVPLTDGFQWLAGTPALLTLGSAAAFEVLAYYVPGVDHLLDLIAGPAAVGAGIVVSASVMADIPPAVMWPVAIIAGGGVAGLAKGTTALLRAKSGVMTAGLANPVLATLETVVSAGVAILAVVVPLLCFAMIVLLMYWAAKKAGRLLVGRDRHQPGANGS